ncbi:dirigent protein 15 [Gossypium raimondii]|uniref:Dirigent protein n=1 Tax=Gossypium raimondii TaxID=29730 RepID=A0A0D2Q106_GOSRA|nr:dirigent protein 15 [Gossypium raimondii]KJB13004.1 hypothetical protein B456_002G050600 [Gossypium raimondii]
MENQMTLAWAIIFCLAVAPVHGQYYSRTVKAGPRVEKITRLHFFFDDIRSGKNATAIPIASPNTTQDPPTYGTLYAMDDPLTMESEPTSTLIGNSQGLYLDLSRERTQFTAIIYADFAFTTGRFNGSSFSLFSRFSAADAPSTIREMAIVGGRGAFRMATGFALLRVTWSNTMGDAIVEFNVTLYHY